MQNFMREAVQRCLQDQATIGRGPIMNALGTNKNFQFVMDADAPGATATLRVYGTLRPDGKDLVQLGNDIAMDTTTGTHYVNGLINTDAWAHIQVEVAAIAGTNPRINGWMLAA